MRRIPRTRMFLTVLISATLSLALSSPGSAAAFGDVDDNAYYTDAVAWMVGEDLTTGVETGCFGPSFDVTRGQVAAFLHRLDESLGNDPLPIPHPFVDVTAPYQQDPVGWLYGAGLTTGVSPTGFAPNDSISRGDFAVLLWRYAGAPAADGPSPFLDVSLDYQRVAIAWMAEQNITTGTTPTTFDPDGFVNRAQAATFLFRFVDPVDVQTALTASPCTRGLRLALEVGGLTTPEALCAAPWLTDFEVGYILDVVEDRQAPSFELIFAAATIGAECLTPDRVADLSRVFL